MEVVNYIMAQGVPKEAALELAERAKKNPRLVSIMHGGQLIRVQMPTNYDSVNAMLETGVGPFLMTDSTFLENRCNGNQFEGREWAGDDYKAVAKKAGVSTTGKVYMSSLATFPGDPKAWVSGRGDVQKYLEETGRGSTGAVTVKAREAEEPPPPPIGVAESCVDREVRNVLEGQTVTKKEYVEAREKVRERLTPFWKRGKATRKEK
jgi:hypothetical protein